MTKTSRSRDPLLFLALALIAGGAPSPEEKALSAVQKRYDQVQDLRARFVQTSTSGALADTSTTRGTVLVQRPGKIRWTYDPPDGREIVLDGETIRIYSPEDRQLQIAPLAEGGVSPTALSFLMGAGRLSDEFTGRIVKSEEGKAAPGLGLELVPRADSGFESLVLWLDPKTHELRESVLVDLFGNRTRIELSAAVYNAGVEPDAFRFDPPKGTQEIDLRTAR
jgi:outer membrane lipoprotein carrier protein